MSLADFPFEILPRVMEFLLVRDLPIQTDYITAEEDGTGGRWPLPFRKTSITRSDLAPLATSKAVREAALRIFWRENTFLYCPRSKANKKVCCYPLSIPNRGLSSIRSSWFDIQKDMMN